MILFELRAAVLAALADHGLDQPKMFFARVVRKVGDRLSVQKIDSKDNADDANPIEVWPGVPGVSSDPGDGEQVAVTLIGQKQVPIVTHRGDPSGPLPVEVRHDATTAIRMVSKVGSAAAKVYVGSTTVAVAKEPQVTALDAALTAFATTVSTATTAAQIAAAAVTLLAALNAISGYGTTKLEAE